MQNDLNKLSNAADNAPVDINTSKLFIRSMGRAAQNIDGVNPLLEIIPIEDLGYVHGEINVDRELLIASGVDMMGNSFVTQIETSNVILAEWMSLGSNRASPPSVRRGERVIIWQYGDFDKYYWTTCGFDENLRRLETAIWRFSNTRDEKETDLTAENSYWWEVSTHRKHLTLMTSVSDGEKHKYTIQIDTANSKLLITDDQDNYFEIDTPAKKMTMKNTSNSYVILNDKNIEINAPEKITITCTDLDVKSSATTSFDAGTTTAMTSGTTTTMKAGTSTSVESGSTTTMTSPTTTIDASSGLNMNTPSLASKTDDMVFDTATTTFNSPTTTFNSSTSVFNTSAKFVGTITSNGKDISSSHTHQNSGGSGTSGPVS